MLLSNDYPLKPPKCRLFNKIYQPINQNGRIMPLNSQRGMELFNILTYIKNPTFTIYAINVEW